jgi:hypothetical protein
VRGQLLAVATLPPALEAIRSGDEPAIAPTAPTGSATGASEEALRTAREEAARARTRLREQRDQRDAARRRAQGAERRAAAAEAEVDRLRRELEAMAAEQATLQHALAEAEVERRRAVEREAHRHEADVERLRAELAALRRAEEERRLASRRREDARRQAERDAAESAAVARREVRAHRGARVRPGRPSVLPEGIAPDTAEAADALLHAGRLVFVDGYNLTLQHRGHLPLETQRTWVTQLLATAAAQRRVRPVVVFDGERATGRRPLAGSREVEVRFTPSGITADDELVLAVEATDEPVLVVTDDRELRARVLASGADVVGTGPFLWAVS